MTVGVTLFTESKTEEELQGLVWGLTRTDSRPEEIEEGDKGWYRSPTVLATGALVLAAGLSLVFSQESSAKCLQPRVFS